MDRLVKLSDLFFTLSKPTFALTMLTWLSCAQLCTAQSFPYMAYVTGDNVYVRSGPGQRYYPTSQLEQGFAVEVYRHEADGWCAIRPPEKSFSWVASHQVRQISAGIVEVVEDNVVTRVGSVLSPSRTAVQVLLPKGEQVELIPAGEDEDPRWVRVAPPAGEFRWIASSMISRQPPMELNSKTESVAVPDAQPENSGWISRTPPTPSKDLSEADQVVYAAEPGEQVAALQFEAQQPQPINQSPTTAPNDPNAMDIVTGSPADLQLAQFQAQAAPLPTQSAPPALLSGGTQEPPLADSTRPRVRFRGMSAASSATIGSIEELELRLSQAVVKPPTQWELEPLEEAASTLLKNTTPPPLKAQLRDVLARITRFQEVQQGYTNPGPTIVPERDPFDTTAAQPTTAIGALKDTPRDLTGLSSDVRERIQEDLAIKARASRPTAPSTVTKPLYDATGLLKPVVSKRQKAPQFALVDEQGKVVSFITPTPELDLKPYLGRRIGVHGDRGYMPEYRRAHVTAGRVTPIEGTVRR